MKRSRVLSSLVLAASALIISGCAGGPSARDADRQFQSGADRAPTAQTLYNAARLMVDQGRDEEAIWTLKRVNRDYPAFSPAYCALAECHMRANRNGEAVTILNTGLQKAGEDAVLINNLGICAMMKGEYDTALAHFTRAAGLAPGNVRYRANMAAALGRMGRFDESLTLYKQVLPEVDSHYNVAVLAEGRNDKDRAAREYAEVARLEQIAGQHGSKADPNGSGSMAPKTEPAAAPANPAPKA
jgi:Flp pilus assembly protein TadD